MQRELKPLVVLLLSGLSCVGAGLVNPSLTPPGGGGGGPTNGQTAAQVATQIQNTNNNVVIPLIQASTNGLSPTNFVSYSWANGTGTTNAGNAVVLDGFNPNGSIRVKGTNWPTGGGGGGSLFPPNAAGVLLNDGAGNTNWLSTNAIINTASNNVINVLPSRTNYYQVTNGLDGNAVVIVGPDVSGQFYLKGTNWPTGGGGSTPFGLVTNFGTVTVVVPAPLVITNTSEADSIRLNTLQENLASFAQQNLISLQVLARSNGNTSIGSGIDANWFHTAVPRGGVFLDTDSQFISSNSITRSGTWSDTNNTWHYFSNNVETITITPSTGTMSGSNLNATGSGASSNWFGGISYVASNAAPSALVVPSGLNSITMNQGWTNNFNRLADLEVLALFTDAVTGNPNLAFTNTVTGQAWTNSPLSALIAGTSQITIIIPDVSPNDFGSFSNYSGTGASVSFVKAWWHLK